MNRNIVFLIILIFSISALHAEAPELKNVMPNSWRKVTKLTANEEQAFRKENSAVLAQIKESMQKVDSFWTDRNKYDFLFIYQQSVGRDIFYRILCPDSSTPNFLSPNIRFHQFLIYQNTYITAGPYNRVQVWQRFTSGNYCSIDIIEGKRGAKGVLVTHLFVLKNTDNHAEWGQDAYRKKQLHGQTESEYYPIAEVKRMINRKEYTTLRITASDCLVDPNIPLRYSLQNAFDGDPSTSYVENTEDDLMEIYFGIDYGDIEAIAVINGYSQNDNSYKSNNRIKEIEDDKGYGDKYYLKDNTLTFQILKPYGNSFIYVTDLYKGTRYNDTCIAELNVKTNSGWLFGDINEQ